MAASSEVAWPAGGGRECRRAAGEEEKEGDPVADVAVDVGVGGAVDVLRRRTLPRGVPAFWGRLWRREAFVAAAEGGAVPSSPQREGEERHNLEGGEKKELEMSVSLSLLYNSD